jgi:hypothetical protein
MTKRHKRPLPKSLPRRKRPVKAIMISISLSTVIGGGAALWHFWPRPSCSVAMIGVDGPGRLDNITVQNNTVTDNCNH